MGDYNPKTSYQFRWSDSKKIQKFIQGQVVVHDVSFDVSPSQDVVTVTKADKDYTGQALYLDASSNVQPAFIRYSAGNVIIQLQNGSIAPVKTITDIVTTI